MLPPSAPRPRLHLALVEDDPLVAESLSDFLAGEAYDVHACPSGAALRALLPQQPIDLILLDLGLPDEDGFALAAQIRAFSPVPIIMLTGRGTDVDRIVGLELGADDYVVKPFNPRELLARIKAVTRRTTPAYAAPPLASPAPPPVPSGPRGYQFAGWTLDLALRRLVHPDGTLADLSTAEFELLTVLVEGHGEVLSRAEILRRCGRTSDAIFERSIDVTILRLRRKIEANPQQPAFIRTERGVGYLFATRPTPLN
ncbi:MAG: response regulator [Elstera sp.]|jgi:DNA-binding response OmpR family regulator